MVFGGRGVFMLKGHILHLFCDPLCVGLKVEVTKCKLLSKFLGDIQLCPPEQDSVLGAVMRAFLVSSTVTYCGNQTQPQAQRVHPVLSPVRPMRCG